MSRPHTVTNSLVDPVEISDAISRSSTVDNRAIRRVVIGEAISRPHTVENRVTPEVAFQEALARSQTINNKAARQVTFAEAISRSTTVLNHPELRLELQSQAGASTVYARCGETIRYRVVGTMSEGNNQGLALVGFDVRFDGGDLTQMDRPTGKPSCGNPMVSFVGPAGITASTGFGGMPVAAQGPLCGRPNGVPAGLVHVGGAQNTFNHVGVNLNGQVLSGVARPGGCGRAVIAEGTLVAPSAPGEYRVSIENAYANAIARDATGNPSWQTRPAVVSAGSELIINVVGLRCVDPCEFDFFLLTECAARPSTSPAPLGPFVSPGECLGAFDEDNDLDVDLRDIADLLGCFRPSVCMDQRIVASFSPPACAIDARQPTEPNGLNQYGFDSITLAMGCPAGDLTPSSFTVSATPAGSVPSILNVTPSGREVTLELSAPISPGQWTCVTHIDSETKACIGFLPGDVDNNRTVDFADITTLESLLNAPAVPLYRCDVDRGGVCNDLDLDRLEYLFFGDGAFDFWLGQMLPDCPSAP